MKAPKQHNWMGADLSSSGPQPRPYVWMYDEGQYDHHVLQFRQDRTRDAALLATAAFESSGLSLSGAGLANMSIPMLHEILKSQFDDRSRRRELMMRLAQVRIPFK